MMMVRSCMARLSQTSGKKKGAERRPEVLLRSDGPMRPSFLYGSLRRDAALVFVGARVDLDAVAGLAERRHLDQVAGRELGGLQHLARRVPAHRGLGVDHLAHDGGGHLEGDRAALV